ncbi:MAG TPA: DUF481 domain-containing protein [Nitrospiria bacterium]
MTIKKTVFLITILSLLVLASPAALPVLADSHSELKGDVEVSYLQTDGNSESVSFAGAGKTEWKINRSKLFAEAKGIYGKKDGETSDKSWFGRLRYDFLLSERTSVFLMETVERNTLKGIEFRYYHQGGISYMVIKTEKDMLKIEVAGGYVTEDPVAPSRIRGYPSAAVLGAYEHAFTEKSRFEQTVEYIPSLKDGEDYLIKEETAIITNLLGKFALKASFQVTFDNKPPTDFEKSDRVFRTSLLYTF